MSEEKRVSIYEYQPEHFGDTILEGVIVRDIHTVTIHNVCRSPVVVWRWNYAQLPSREIYAGPWDDELQIVHGTAEPPARSEVMADIAKTTRALLEDCYLRTDAFEAA